MSAKADLQHSKDRRRTKRRRTRLAVRFWDDGDIEGRGFTADISDSGLFVQTSMKIEVGTRLHLEIALETGTFFCEGVVARKRLFPQYARTHYKSGIGLRIVGLGEVIRGIQVTSGEVESGLEVDLRDPAELGRVFMQDVKLGGLMVKTEDPPPLHEEVKVRVLLPEPHSPMTVSGTVLHLMPDLPGLALQISNVDQVRGRLADVLASL